MDIVQIIITVVLTIVLQTLLIVFIGNKFLKFAFDKVGELITGPTISKAFGIIGKKSGESRRNKALENEISSSVLDHTIGKFKPILGTLGIDLDDLIDRYGATEVLGMAQTFLPMLQGMGINIGQLVKPSQSTPQNLNSELGL